MPNLDASTPLPHTALAPYFAPRPSFIPMHENACKFTVSAKRNFLPAHYPAGVQCPRRRAGPLTGRYPIRFGLTYSLMTNPPTGIPDTETLLPQLLQKQGYATMLAGKWHLGDQPKFHPLKHGFDHF